MYNVVMKPLSFQWDRRKSVTNLRKHGVSFEEARTVFFDDRALLIVDPEPSRREERFVILGLSAGLRMLVVCHCYRDQQQEEVIRIISARKANRQERTQYERRWTR